MMQIRLKLSRGCSLSHSFYYFDSRITQCAYAPASDSRIWIGKAYYDANNSGFDYVIDARICSARVTTGFERRSERRSSRGLTSSFEGNPFRVRSTCRTSCAVEYFSVFGQNYGTYPRIRCCGASN